MEHPVEEPGSAFDSMLRNFQEDQGEEAKDSHKHVTNPVYYSTCGKWCYQIAIIDYLQTFDRGKKQEVLAKKLFKNADSSKLSAVPPDPYGNRFIKFMKDFVFQFDAKTEKKNQMDVTQAIKEIEDHIKMQIAVTLREIFAKQGKTIGMKRPSEIKVDDNPKEQLDDSQVSEEVNLKIN